MSVSTSKSGPLIAYILSNSSLSSASNCKTFSSVAAASDSLSDNVSFVSVSFSVCSSVFASVFFSVAFSVSFSVFFTVSFSVTATVPDGFVDSGFSVLLHALIESAADVIKIISPVFLMIFSFHKTSRDRECDF